MGNAISEGGGQTTRLGSFEIVRKLARGGMAEIFLARTRGPSGFEKLVVLKKVLPKYAGKQRFVQLFLDEARLAASLDHPNIAQVYDIGMVDGSYFFTMEYLHGQDLRSILHRTWRTGEKFPIEHAVQIARHIASALHFAHDKPGSDGTLLGIVHRDVSPSNVIVTYDGATKLLDFGVAKTSASTVKTRTGALKGKIAYMSPEQARGAPLDRRSDIFSLGIMLWEMVTTQRLYRGDNDLATLQLIINQPARPPSAVRPDCPPELERIVMRALAEDPTARYATAEQLVTELDELAREHKLKQSPNALAATMGQLFAVELAAWREARAAGVPLADHLHDAGDMTTPVSESNFIELDGLLDDEDEVDEVEDEVDDDPLAGTVLVGDPLAGVPLGDVPLGDDLLGSTQLGSTQLGGTQLDGAQLDGAQLGGAQLAGDDELDDLDKTEHAAPLLDSLSPLAMEPVEPEARTPPQGMRRAGRHETPSAPTAAFRPLAGSAIAPVDPLDAVTGPTEPGGALIPVTEPLELIGSLAAPTGRAARPSPPLPALGARAGAGPAPGMYATPSAPFVAVGSHASDVAVPVTTPAAMTGPQPTSSAPFAVPPWPSGLPVAPPALVAAPVAPPADDRPVRSWAVVELPAFDPAVFERLRRLVLRIAGGVLGLIFLLAIIAGRC